MAIDVVGYCKECGIAVTEENKGALSPKVLCKNCYQAELDAQEKERQSIIEEQNKKERMKEYDKERMRWYRNLSMIVGGACALVVIILFLISGIKNGNTGSAIGIGFAFGYVVFSFVASLFFEGVVRDVICWMAERSISFPGLIFSFDLDGLIWLIGMKILFAVLGFLAGVLFAIIGVLLGILMAPFCYPFSLIHQNRCIRKGDTVSFN